MAEEIEHKCEMADHMVEFHRWLHHCFDGLEEVGKTDEAIAEAEILATKITDLLNDAECMNAVKMLALYNVIVNGLENCDAAAAQHLRASDTVN